MSDAAQPTCPDCRTDDGGESYICDPTRTLCPYHVRTLQRVTQDDRTGIDEIVLTGVDVHIEALSDKSFTLIFTRPDGFHLQADLWASRKPLTMRLLEANDAAQAEVAIEEWVWK